MNLQQNLASVLEEIRQAKKIKYQVRILIFKQLFGSL